MTNRAQEAYLTEKILSADPVELVRMLYAGAFEAVEAAHTRLLRGDIRGRSAAISKAVQILSELSGTLDHQHAPELSRNLAALYDYMQRRLLEANFRQTDAPLTEVLGLLQTLTEAWKGASSAPVADRPVTPAAPVPKPRLAGCNAMALAGDREPALQGWSF